MPAKADTVTIATTATVVACPTDSDDQVAIINLGANNVWVNHHPTDDASVDGDNCEVILPGTATVLMWLAPGDSYSMIAETGNTKINIVNRQGR